MQIMTVHEAKDPETLEKIIGLRYEVLRKPWGQSYESATDDREKDSINAYITDEDNTVIACGRLQRNDERTAQIRYMAVAPGKRGKGLGTEILLYLEDRARDWEVERVHLQARENALAFYESQGYAVIENSFLLWGKILHFLMEKTL